MRRGQPKHQPNLTDEKLMDYIRENLAKILDRIETLEEAVEDLEERVEELEDEEEGGED